MQIRLQCTVVPAPSVTEVPFGKMSVGAVPPLPTSPPPPMSKKARALAASTSSATSMNNTDSHSASSSSSSYVFARRRRRSKSLPAPLLPRDDAGKDDAKLLRRCRSYSSLSQFAASSTLARSSRLSANLKSGTKRNHAHPQKRRSHQTHDKSSDKLLKMLSHKKVKRRSFSRSTVDQRLPIDDQLLILASKTVESLDSELKKVKSFFAAKTRFLMALTRRKSTTKDVCEL